MNYSQIYTFLLDILFPRYKHTQNMEKISVQTFCKNIPYAKEHSLPYIDSAFEYRNPLTKKIVWEIKYHNNKNLAEKVAVHMHDILIEEISEDILFKNVTKPILVPIPMSKQRKRIRGFNQALLLARCIYKIDPSMYKKISNSLSYKRKYIPQTTIKHRKKRMENMEDCFYIKNPKEIEGQNIIIVDDVSTTGATIKEARRVLKESGAKHIRAITIAH